MNSLTTSDEMNSESGAVISTYAFGPHTLQMVTPADGPTKVHHITSNREVDVRLYYKRYWDDEAARYVHRICADIPGRSVNLNTLLDQTLEARSARDMFIAVARTYNVELIDDQP